MAAPQVRAGLAAVCKSATAAILEDRCLDWQGWRVLRTFLDQSVDSCHSGRGARNNRRILVLVDILSSGPGEVMLLVATVLVIAESALLIGVVMPGFGVPIAIGVLSAAGAVPWTASVPCICIAAALGRCIAFLRGRNSDLTSTLARVRDVPMVRSCLNAVASRPRTVVVLSQWFAVVRTLVPRLAAAELSLRAFVLVAVPAAVAWASTALFLGRLLHDSSRLAAGIVRVDQTLAIGIPVLVVLTALVSWRRARGRRRPSHGRDGSGTPRSPT